MFNNTVYLLQASSDQIPFALVDGPTNRKTIRASADGAALLTIGHTNTDENGKAYPTQRTVVRLEHTIQVSESSDVVRPYVQFIMSVPKGQVDVDVMRQLTARLANFLIKGDGDETASAEDLAGSEVAASINRLYAGEP